MEGYKGRARPKGGQKLAPPPPRGFRFILWGGGQVGRRRRGGGSASAPFKAQARAGGDGKGLLHGGVASVPQCAGASRLLVDGKAGSGRLLVLGSLPLGAKVGVPGLGPMRGGEAWKLQERSGSGRWKM